MELLASAIIFVLCLQTNLDFLWKLFLLLVSSDHLLPPVMLLGCLTDEPLYSVFLRSHETVFLINHDCHMLPNTS